MTTVTLVTPAALRQDAITLANGTATFLGAKTTDPNGAPPATHYLSSGLVGEFGIPQSVVDAFLADARFVVSFKSWQDTCLDMGLFNIVEEL